MRVEHRYYVILQKGEKNLAIIERRNTAEEIVDVLKRLNSIVVKDLEAKGLTEDNIAEGIEQEVTATEMAYYMGPGSSNKGEFDIFVQSEWIKIYDGEEGDEELDS